MCVKPNGFEGQTCPTSNGQGDPARLCIAKHLTAESCENAGGTWTRFISNFLEKTSGVLSTCQDVGEMKLARGVPYEAHKVSQGADNQIQYVLLQKPPEVIYAPSTVVNHNGLSMGTEGKFSTYKWKVPCFPSNTTQRCVLRLRWVKLQFSPPIVKHFLFILVSRFFRANYHTGYPKTLPWWNHLNRYLNAPLRNRS